MIDYNEDPWVKSVKFFLVKATIFICNMKHTLRNVVAVEDKNCKSFVLPLKYYSQHAN